MICNDVYLSTKTFCGYLIHDNAKFHYGTPYRRYVYHYNRCSQNGRRSKMEVTALWMIEAATRGIMWLTPVVADRKYPPLNTGTGTGTEHTCLLALYPFPHFSSWELTYNFMAGSQALIGARHLGAKTWTLGMLRIATITKFKEHQPDRWWDADMLWHSYWFTASMT